MRMSDWSSDVCSSDLRPPVPGPARRDRGQARSCRLVFAAHRRDAGDRRFRQSRRAALRAARHAGARQRLGIAARRQYDREDTMISRRTMLMGASALATTPTRSEEHTSELQSLMRISYAGFCLKKKKIIKRTYRYEDIRTDD